MTPPQCLFCLSLSASSAFGLSASVVAAGVPQLPTQGKPWLSAGGDVTTLFTLAFIICCTLCLICYFINENIRVRTCGHKRGAAAETSVNKCPSLRACSGMVEWGMSSCVTGGERGRSLLVPGLGVDSLWRLCQRCCSQGRCLPGPSSPDVMPGRWSWLAALLATVLIPAEP